MSGMVKYRLIIVMMSVIGYLVCNMTFLFGHRRKKWFALRVIAGCGCIGAAAYGAAWLQALTLDKTGETIVKSLTYLFVIVVVSAVQMWWYDDFVQELLMSVIAGIAMNMMITSIPFHATGELFQQYRVIYWARYIVIPVLVYIFYARKNERLRKNNYNKSILGISAITLVIYLFLLGSIPTYEAESMQLAAIGRAISFFCGLFVLALRHTLIHTVSLENSLITIENLRNQERMQYQITKASMDLVNARCHDLKKYFRQMEEHMNRETFSELEEAVIALDGIFHTGNRTMDLVLNEKNRFCMQNEIQLTCMGDASGLNYMSEYDLYSLVGNALDNAIEAVVRLQDNEKKIINFSLSQDGTKIKLDMMNYFDGELNLSDGVPGTRKISQRYHGFGVMSMRMIAEKYGGNLSLGVENDIFRLQIEIPCEKEN